MSVISYNDFFKKKKKKEDEDDIAPTKKSGSVISLEDFAKENNMKISLDKPKTDSSKGNVGSLSDSYVSLSDEDLYKKEEELRDKMLSYGTEGKSALTQLWEGMTGKTAKKLEKDEGYQQLKSEYDAIVEARENKYVENKKYKDGAMGYAEKVGDTISGNALTSMKGIETTAKKILGQTPDERLTTQSFQEKLSAKARQETTGAGAVGLDVIGSVTRMLPQMMVGNPIGATALGFANYGGSAYNQARQDGYSDAQATAYGVAIGSMEMIMTKALGSFGNIYGKSAVGKASQSIIDKTIPKIISNKQVREVIAQFGSEATEEFLQEYIDGIAKDTLLDGEGFLKSTWKNITDEDKFSDALYSAFVGGITGSAMATPTAIDSYRYEKATGRNYETGLTQNEQTVVDKVTEQRTSERQKQAAIDKEVNKTIKAQEKTFGTLSDGEKKGIKQRIQEKVENGEIDIANTKLSKKDIEKIQQEVREDLEKGYIDIDTIDGTFSAEKTAQIKQLQEELSNTKDDTKKAEIQAKISELTSARASELQGKFNNDIYLQRSYIENAKKGEKFTYEAKETDSEYRRTLTEEFKEKANNTNKTHETYEMLVKLSEEKNTQYHITNTEELKNMGYDVEGSDINGLVRVDKDGSQRILINIDSNKAINRIVGHETTHLLEGTKEYKTFQEYIKNYAKAKGEYDTRYKQTSNLYTGIDADIDAEVTADLVGDYLFTDTDFINNLSVEQPSIFQKIYNEIKHLYNLATAGSKEARDLERVKKAFDKAYKQNASNMSETDTKYSLTDDLTTIQQLEDRKQSLEKQIEKMQQEGNTDWRILENEVMAIEDKIDKLNSNTKYSLTKATDEQVDKAESLEVENKTPEEIYLETGAYRGADGIWRTEIDDSEAKITLSSVMPGGIYKLKEILDFPKVYEAYPGLKEYNVKFDNNIGGSGSYNYETKTITINPMLYDIKQAETLSAVKQLNNWEQTLETYSILFSKEQIDEQLNKLKDRASQYDEKLYQQELKSTLLHEIQHFIQEQEGFARGSSVEYWNQKAKITDKALREYRQEKDKLLDKIGYDEKNKEVLQNTDDFKEYMEIMQEFIYTSEYADDIKELDRMIKINMDRYEILTSKSAFEMYQNTYGEQEARNVQDRMNMSTEERKNTIPFYGNDNTVFYETNKNKEKHGIAFSQNDIAPTQYSLGNQETAPSRNDVFGSDIKLQVEEAIAPLQEEIAELKEQLATTQVSEQVDEYAPMTEEEFNMYEELDRESFRNIDETSMPTEIEEDIPYQVQDTTSIDDKSLKMLSKNIKSELGLDKYQTSKLEGIIQDFSTGKIETKEELYDEIKRNFSEYTEQVRVQEIKNVQNDLRATRINVSKNTQNGIKDYFRIKQKNFGKIRFSKEGMGVDSVYQELNSKYPDYFPADIDTESDQFLRIVEVANMQNTFNEKYVLPNEVIQNATDFITESVEDYKYNEWMKAIDEQNRQPIDESMIPVEALEETLEDASNTEVKEEIAPVRREVDWDSIEAIDPNTAKQLTLDGTEEDLVKKTKKELRKALLGTEAQKEFITNVLDNAKNRSMALMNNTDTIRNNELVFGRDAGKIINDVIFQKEIDNEADSIAWQNQERDDIKALGIKARSKESAAVQKYGEKQYVNDAGEVIAYGDNELASEFKDAATQEKIKRAAQLIRNKYDNYIDLANGVLTKLGFEPIKKRNDYMRHFQELNDVFSRYGIPFNAQNMDEHTLPTDINGLTEFWSPQKNYFANMQQRKGLKTTYDAITGIDGYIGGIANLIYHTEDIQRGRAFEELIRETYGEDKGFDNLENLPDELKQARIEKIQDNHLSNYAAWVHEWTNNVAGKKSKVDRSVEAMFGRKVFALLDETRKQVGSNMIGFNLSSSLTNLIAPVQAMAKTNKLAVLKGTADTIKNMFVKDNFMDNNKFLVSRMGSDMISKNAWQKIQDAGFIFMKGMDWFSSNQIVRSKYYELRSKGMSEEQAHAEAGQFAARILGDRTKGANAQLYNSKLIGLVTQFQLEVNNQLYSMFYDTYHESKENAQNNALKTAAGMTFTLGQLFAFTHLFGKTFEALAGYNPTLDVIGILKTAFGWGEDDEDEEKTTGERLKAAADQLVDSLPYVNILTGGGRIPVASGIPNLVGVATGGKDEYGNELTFEDEMKKLLYLIPPTGGNQVKKTTQGLGMFDDDLPVSGSYTDSGNLRYPVEDTVMNRIQAGLFGQYANENAGNYFDNKRQPLKEKQIQEYIDLDLPIADYWEYREGLKDKKKVEEKIEYISGLDVSDEQKNIMINNATNTKTEDENGYAIYKDSNNKNYYYDEENGILYDSKDRVVDSSKLYELTRYTGKDISNYDNFDGYEEFDYATKHPAKYNVISQIDTFENYKAYEETIEDIKYQYQANDNMTSKQKTALSKQRKAAIQKYIQSLNLDKPQKIMLEKMAGGYSIKNYKGYMQSYIESLPLTAEEKQAMHNQLFN